ncbi:MAG: hypothetical protein AB7Q29_11355 [Vicinamibacterales bacterium]
MTPQAPKGNRISPFFDGWYANPDGSFTLAFGYTNLNKETIEIPIGPDNFITPKEFDGMQPTVFEVHEGDDGGSNNAGIVPVQSGTVSGAGPAAPPARRGRGDGFGPNINQHDRERGAFTITIPKDFKGDVVWTLKHGGQTWSVPGRTKRNEYMLSWPMAMGSTPPLLSFPPSTATGRGPMGIKSEDKQAKVGEPIELTVHVKDDAAHEKEPITIKREERPSINVYWLKHQGPVGAEVKFEPAKDGVKGTEGSSSTKATFAQPGEYVVRARVDVHGNVDSSYADQCCWSNGYVKVTVAR